MAIPPGVCRVSLVGRLPQGEIFNTSFWVRNSDIDSSGEANAFALAVANQFEITALGQAGSLISPQSSYDSVRVYAYPSGGPAASAVGEAPIDDGTGGGTGSTLPLQCAMVVSLRSEFSGRRSRGRMYLPLNQDTTSFHQLAATRVNNLADAMAAFLTAVNGLGDEQVAVVSQVGAGATVPVTRVIVDSRIDIQRRRAEDQAVTVAETTVVDANA